MNYIAETGILMNQISDHLPIFIRRKKEREKKSFSKVWGRSMKEYDVTLFQSVIVANYKWRLFWDVGGDVNVLWDIMINIILEAADLICPVKRIRMRDSMPAWFTKELIEMINTKKEIMSRIKLTNREEDHYLLKQQKRLVRNSLKMARQETIIATLEENRTDPKRFWRCLNKNFALGKRSNTSSCVRIKDEEGKMVEGEALANYLGKYYATNGEKLAKAFVDGDPSTIVNANEVNRPPRFLLRFVPLSIIEKYIKEINICKSSGIRDISSLLVKDAFKVLSVELTHIINESIRTSTFPDAWAVGTITPIPKEGDPSLGIGVIVRPRKLEADKHLTPSKQVIRTSSTLPNISASRRSEISVV